MREAEPTVVLRAEPTVLPRSWVAWWLPALGAPSLRMKPAPGKRRIIKTIHTDSSCSAQTSRSRPWTPCHWNLTVEAGGRPGLWAPADTHEAGGEALLDLLDQGLDAAGHQLRQDLLCGQSRGS